ncbi:predicted protein [Histoplasma capsulatum var. duboisii H88]|uniref:Predicted protein n=1 Tax=Ajellomyces capsulatus (strain H88) TaxID=544711 RepID=F0U5S4_AJEC8|nr:predicted protein [Histoplasma capsulatum var. duboisii H88]
MSTGARTVTIIFKTCMQGKWVDTYKMDINLSESSDWSMCCDAAIEDGTNTIFMVFGRELNIDEEMVVSASQYTNSDENKRERPSITREQNAGKSWGLLAVGSWSPHDHRNRFNGLCRPQASTATSWLSLSPSGIWIAFHGPVRSIVHVEYRCD